jgi:hypothetical protein
MLNDLHPINFNNFPGVQKNCTKKFLGKEKGEFMAGFVAKNLVCSTYSLCGS